MSLELSTMRLSFTTLSSLLILDPDIKTSIYQMVWKGRECFNIYESTMRNEGGAILVQKKLILAAKSAGDVNVQGMRISLDGITFKMRAVRDAALALQTNVHSNNESCRGRKQTHETTIATDQLTLKNIEAEIQGINFQIASFAADIVSMNNDAGTLENRARAIDSEESQNEVEGFLGNVASVIGIGLAPFTGGLSLGLTAVGVIYAGKNLKDADDCRQTARNLRALAQTRRTDAHRLREQNAAAAGRTSALAQEIQGLQSKKVQLESTILVLQQMTLDMTNLVKYIDSSLNVFQTMDTTFKDISLHSESFLIIQNALRKQPERLADKAQDVLEELQGKWSNMESVLIANGARAVLTCDKSGINC
ncbi:uncharacterized protein LOC127859075 isoform X2 [Dreissena polymorpha]|uniref:Uncharacterized protein n=2 Tax=Dreissena polymorpha TaxID=45954 RepID=A0A9D4HDJ8_DREPO|nr:uncharacterized protein LOC127859075 isoform X2 [Dreissena polymorpha]XP_052252462.1 uncharacterized protein LOC127859075 isoform X2 [Dreissena polymorpha]XP_052252463.1 uncharacterized protein LOC127859075 isoform X2 [Dreissena polymorpha]KAH3713385.1 hypothetical protein DPMN_073177 [Dreissena polymorpha]